MRKLIVETEKPVKLSAWLKAGFPRLPAWAVKAALKNRDIRVNGVRTGGNMELRSGDEVTLYIDDARLDGPPLEAAWVSRNLVVAVKPPGVTSKAENETDMESLVSAWLLKRGEAPEAPEAAEARACHRLDNQTGGLMMFARNEGTAKAVRAMMEAGKIEKTYTAIVKGVPSPARATLTSYMRKDAEKAIVTVLDRPAPGARTAVTEYAVLESDGERSLLEVKLRTGRTHQIRAQMARIGHPVLGDDKYGDRQFNRANQARKMMLWAGGLEFHFEPDECPELKEIAGKKLDSPAPFRDELHTRPDGNNKTK
jgi:23S rRNA pseudouridine955/2504/2580 synthase